MKSLDEEITRFGVLCKKGSGMGLTKEESREFRRLESSISNAMLKSESIYDNHIKSFRDAAKPLS